MDVAQMAQMAVSMQAAQTGETLALAMVKQQAQMQQNMIAMLDQAVDTAKQVSAPPAGMGAHVNMSA